jgi:hypothetical protein
MEDADQLGREAIIEIAADHIDGRPRITADDVASITDRYGIPAPSARLGLSLEFEFVERLACTVDLPAWKRGSEAAAAFRSQKRLGHAPLQNSTLAELFGLEPRVLTGGKGGAPFAFSFDKSSSERRVVLRSKRPDGRRFELARLLGDRLVLRTGDHLIPATQASTYRQKLQRAFAAEFLCPFNALIDKLAGDYSPESMDNAAAYYKVSPLLVRTLLVNHNVLPRDEIEDDFDASIAA